jgi:type 1 glutamine amidotransferase
MKNTLLLLCLATLLFTSDIFAAAGDKKILVYTRNYVTNGKGYVHDNIPDCVEAIKKLGSESEFSVDVSAEPGVFTPENLKQYAAIVFANSNNEAFETQAQRDAFRRYIRAGGGFVGIHSASGSEREWPWFWSMLGGKFRRHPKIQPFEVRVVDAEHPATKDLPSTFTWTDECYYLDNFDKGIHPLLVTDPHKIEDPQKAEYPGDTFGDSMPLAWYHEFEGGRSFYTALGHRKESYQDPILVKHIRGGILWAMGLAKAPKESAATQKTSK